MRDRKDQTDKPQITVSRKLRQVTQENGRLCIDLHPELDHVEIYTTDGVITVSMERDHGNRRRIIFEAPKQIRIKRVGR